MAIGGRSGSRIGSVHRGPEHHNHLHVGDATRIKRFFRVGVGENVGYVLVGGDVGIGVIVDLQAVVAWAVFVGIESERL